MRKGRAEKTARYRAEAESKAQTSQIDTSMPHVEATDRPFDYDPFRKPDEAEATVPVSSGSNLDELRTNLEAARAAYFGQQDEVKKTKGIKSALKSLVSKETKTKIDEEKEKLFELKSKFEQARAEYMGSNVERFLEERTKLLENQVEVKKKNIFRTIHSQLGEFNLLEQGAKLFGKEYKAKGRLAKMVNARTAIGLCLLGIGVGLGATTAAGAGVLATRRWFSGASAGVGAYELTMGIRGAWNRGAIEKRFAKATTANELSKLIDTMLVRGGLDGKTADEVNQDPLFQKLNERYKELLEQVTATELKARALENYLSKSIQETEYTISKTKFDEKLMRGRVAVGSSMIGMFVGTGGTRAIYKFFSQETSVPSGRVAVGRMRPETEAAAAPKTPTAETLAEPKPQPNAEIAPTKPSVEPTPELKATKVNLFHNGKATGAWAEVKGTETIVHAGNRGLEGSLLDLKDRQPDQYGKMIKWLEQQPYNKDVSKPDQLVHRYVLNYAQEHDMTVDEAGKNLSRIMQGEIHIKADGSLVIDQKDIAFSAKPQALEQIEPPEAPGTSKALTVTDTEHEIEAVDAKTQSVFNEETVASKPITEAEVEANEPEQASEALEQILDQGSERFLKSAFNLTPKDFDNIGHRSISQFMSDYEYETQIFHERYQELFDTLSKLKIKQSTTIREFVLLAAEKYKQLR